MEEDPYKPPESNLQNQVELTRKGSTFKAILYGVAVDTVGSMLIGVAIAFLAAFYLGLRGYQEADIIAFFQNPHESVLYFIVGFIPGVWMDYYAGYLTAKTANYLEYWHALIMILVVLILHYAQALDQVWTWYGLLGIVAGITAALYGAYVHKLSKVT